MKRGIEFIKELKSAESEYDVQQIYTKELNYYYPDVKIRRPYNSDGLIEKGQLKLIMELKYSENFLNISTRCETIIQALYYIKRFQDNGEILPNIILIGDKDEIFLTDNYIITKYIGEDIDWSIAPSKAAIKNPELILKMVNDSEIIPHYFPISETFCFSEVIDKINSLVHGLNTYVPITESNISAIYDYFITIVIKDYKKYTTNELVNIFITLMINPKNNYKHPEKKNVLVHENGKEIAIHGDMFNGFFKHFQREYTPREKEKFTEIADRLLEDTSRRLKGEFYTPTNWVNEAHKMITETLGPNWRDNYIVWDCAWGTGNLTRDYSFKELYCSTLFKTDIEIGSKYNYTSKKFQYDFLNDDIELLIGKDLLYGSLELPKELLTAFETDKPILFLINPPYGSAGTMKTDGSSKKGITNSEINLLMKIDKMGACSQQLYAQFLFRILLMKLKYNLSNVVICLFSTPLFLTGSSFIKFRKLFLSNFRFETAMLFKASQFDDVSDTWGISFSIWSSGETKDKNNFKHIIKELCTSNANLTNEIIPVGIKNIYNLDNDKTFSDWIKEDVKALKTYDAPLLSSALKVKEKGYGRLAKDALGYYVNSGNSIYDNNGDVFLVSGCSSRGHGISVLPCNFNRVVASFTARKLITGKYSTWINNKDEYIVPDTKHHKYIEWCNDSIIYSLFNTSSNQSSLRNIKHNNEYWNIKNEFFFMSNSEMLNLADKFSNDEVYQDAKYMNNERYVYKLLNEIEQSFEAKNLLNKAISLIKKSFQYRILLSEDHPEYHLNTWDAGWYQIKLLLKLYFKEELQDFNYLYDILQRKLRSYLYELKILK
jgi:hypothetical protein